MGWLRHVLTVLSVFIFVSFLHICCIFFATFSFIFLCFSVIFVTFFLNFLQHSWATAYSKLVLTGLYQVTLDLLKQDADGHEEGLLFADDDQLVHTLSENFGSHELGNFCYFCDLES